LFQLFSGNKGDASPMI